MRAHPSPRWPTYLLCLLCLGAIAAAVLVVGPASGSTTGAGRTITVARGVVQSTVSGAGNIQAATQLDLGFKTSGVITRIYVAPGEHVTPGRLLAELAPTSAEVTLEQARASLQAGEANLIQVEESGGESTSGSSSGTGRASAASAAAAPSAGEHAGTNTTASAPTSKATLSPALREANIASARAAVKSDRLTVQSAEEALSHTKLFAPTSGTIVSLSGEVGETVSGGGTSRASSGGSGSGASTGVSGAGGSAGATGSAGGASSGSGSSSSGGSGSSGASSTAFAVLSDLSSMQLVVPLSESEVTDVRPGQPATVTVEALEGLELAAHVLSVATLPTSTSGVVSYDVTFQLDQLTNGLKPGMSATAEVVVKQAEGVNVPTSAISAGTVTVVHDGTQTRRRAVTGLTGNSSTIVLSGLRAGEEILLPVARASSAAGLTSRLGSRIGALGGAGLGGGGGAFLGGAGGGFRGG